MLGMTPVELRERGYRALVRELGPLDAIRFLQQMGWGTGDYTQEREALIGSVSREEFWRDLQSIRNQSAKNG
jgi:hypothetical protein